MPINGDDLVSSKKDLIVDNNELNISAYDEERMPQLTSYVSALTQLDIVATGAGVEAVKHDLDTVNDDLNNKYDNLDGKISDLDQELDYKYDELTASVQHKVFVKGELTADGEYSDLSVVKIAKAEYDELVALSGDTLSNNVLYVIDSDYEDAYGQQIKNLADATDLSDAVNKKQLDAVSAVAGSAVQSVELSSVDGEAADTFLKKYIVKVDGAALAPEIVVPKDKVVDSGKIVEITREGTDPDYVYKEDGHEITGEDLVAIKKVYDYDGKYLKLLLQNANSVYVPVPALIDTYYAGTGLQLDEETHTFSILSSYTLSREQLSTMLEPVKDAATGTVKNVNDISFADVVSCLYNIGAELYGAPAASEPEP